MWKLKCQETKICRQREWKLKCQEAKICRQREWKLKFQGGLAHYAPRFCPRQVKLQQSRKLDLSCVEDWFWHRSGSPMLFWQGFAYEECSDITCLRSNYQNVIVTNIFHRLQSTSKIGFTSRMLQALLLSLSQLLFGREACCICQSWFCTCNANRSLIQCNASISVFLILFLSPLKRLLYFFWSSQLRFSCWVSACTATQYLTTHCIATT